MIRTATLRDLTPLRDLFNRANDSPYDLAAVAEEKCFGEGFAGASVTRVFEEHGQIKAAAVTCGKWLRILIVDRDARRRGIGSALLTNEQIAFGEPGNYLTPGVLDTDEATIAFLKARGFHEQQSTWNLEADITQIEGHAKRPDPTDQERVLAFVEREFGRMWRFEAAKAFERDVVPAFIEEESGEITGFSVHDVNNRGLGFFGPTGVAKSARGKGAGCRLLLASLADLRRLGHARAIIPWTDALDFYRKCCGAKPAHRFIAFTKAEP